MELLPRDTGVYAKCECGSRMFIPTQSALKSPVMFCPCGDITKIDKTHLNQVMARNLRSHISKKCGQLYRPTASEERTTKKDWFDGLE